MKTITKTSLRIIPGLNEFDLWVMWPIHAPVSKILAVETINRRLQSAHVQNQGREYTRPLNFGEQLPKLKCQPKLLGVKCFTDELANAPR